MKFDLALPSLLLIITLASTILYPRFKERFSSILGQTKLRIRDIAIMVVIMGAAVALIAFIPQLVILVFFSASYMLVLFTFAYALTKKWYIAACVSTLYILAYAYLWNTVFLNLFTVTLAILIATFIGSSLSWKTSAVFACLLTAMDVFQVFGTRFMVVSAEKLIALRLPVAVILPMFPSSGKIVLGLGDLFLAGVLAIQVFEKYGLKTGLASTGVSALVFLTEESLLLNSGIDFFPATIMVAAGWLTSLGAIKAHTHLRRSIRSITAESPPKQSA